MSALTPSQLKVHNAITDRVQEVIQGNPLVTHIYAATIGAVVAGGAADGSALAYINRGSRQQPVAYLAGYTPAVGHIVAVSQTGGTPLILGRIIGTPP